MINSNNENDQREAISPWDMFVKVLMGAKSELNVYYTCLALKKSHPSRYECWLHFMFYGGSDDLHRRFRVDYSVPSLHKLVDLSELQLVA